MGMKKNWRKTKAGLIMNTLAIIFLIAVVVTIVPIINNHLQKYGNIFYIFFFSTKVEYF